MSAPLEAPSLKRTPLHSLHRELGAKMVDFGGWEMPVQYTSIMDEHLAVRKAAGLFDTTFPHAAWEDIEIAYRMMRMGMKILYRPAAVARHYHDIRFDSFRRRQQRSGEAAAIFFEKHREQKARPEPAAECRQQSRASARPEGSGRMTVLREEIGPDHDVSVFDVREPGVDVFFLVVRLRRGEKAIEIGRVRFVLPVVLEGMDVDLATLWGCFAGL